MLIASDLDAFDSSIKRCPGQFGNLFLRQFINRQMGMLVLRPSMGNFIAIVHTGKRQARVDPPPVRKNGTGPALPVIASFFASDCCAGCQARWWADRVRPNGPVVKGERRTHGRFLRYGEALCLAIGPQIPEEPRSNGGPLPVMEPFPLTVVSLVCE